MLGLAGEHDFHDNLMEINLMPVSISYEYDPNDYLKAREFLLKRRNPDFKKSQRDDLFSMETGLLQPKGRVHYTVGNTLTDELKELPNDLDKTSIARDVCQLIDCQIHSGFKIFPINYIAYDKLHDTDEFACHYNADDVVGFERYIDEQLAKVEDVPDDCRRYGLYAEDDAHHVCQSFEKQDVGKPLLPKVVEPVIIMKTICVCLS